MKTSMQIQSFIVCHDGASPDAREVAVKEDWEGTSKMGQEIPAISVNNFPLIGGGRFNHQAERRDQSRDVK